MADQKRWFKVWTSLLVDFDHLSNEQIGHWVKLGCRIALVGNQGSVKFSSFQHAATFLGLSPNASSECVKSGLLMLPNVSFEEGQNVNGEITVTMKNWKKYQIDSTVAERVKRLRRKRREDERRGDKRRAEEKRGDDGEARAARPNKRSTQFPDDFEVTKELREWAIAQGLGSPDAQLEAFKDHHLSKGNTFVDWTRAFRTWMRNERKWSVKSKAQRFEEQQRERLDMFAKRGL